MMEQEDEQEEKEQEEKEDGAEDLVAEGEKLCQESSHHQCNATHIHGIIDATIMEWLTALRDKSLAVVGRMCAAVGCTGISIRLQVHC